MSHDARADEFASWAVSLQSNLREALTARRVPNGHEAPGVYVGDHA